MRTTFEDFIERAKEIHGNRYDYSKVLYETTETKVTIICKVHGEFLMRPRAHYADKRGCPICEGGKKSGFSYNSPWAKRTKTLYFIEAFNNTERFVKIGVTEEESMEIRFQKGEFPYDYKILYDIRDKDASIFEREIKKEFQNISYIPELFFRGNTECFNVKYKRKILKYMKNLNSIQS